MRLRPRSHQVDGGWITATRRGLSVVPAGYCVDHVEIPHSTMAESDLCYRKYLLEETLHLDGTYGEPQPCNALTHCSVLTNRVPVINGYPRWPLCDEHRTVEVVTMLWNRVKEDTASDDGREAPKENMQ